MVQGFVRRNGAAHKITEQLRVLQVEYPGERRAFLRCRLREVAFQVAQQHQVELLHAAPAAPAQPRPLAILRAFRLRRRHAQCCRSTIIFLISAIALAGLRSFGQACAQFMIVWQR